MNAVDDYSAGYASGWSQALRWAADYVRDAEGTTMAADMLTQVADHWTEIHTADYWAEMAKRSTSKQPTG